MVQGKTPNINANFVETFGIRGQIILNIEEDFIIFVQNVKSRLYYVWT